jgi:transposase-like protein
MKEIKETAKDAEIKPCRNFDPEFKRQAVALWLNSGKTARQIGAELGIDGSHLYTWKKEFAPLGHFPSLKEIVNWKRYDGRMPCCVKDGAF